MGYSYAKKGRPITFSLNVSLVRIFAHWLNCLQTIKLKFVKNSWVALGSSSLWDF